MLVLWNTNICKTARIRWKIMDHAEMAPLKRRQILPENTSQHHRHIYRRENPKSRSTMDYMFILKCVYLAAISAESLITRQYGGHTQSSWHFSSANICFIDTGLKTVMRSQLFILWRYHKALYYWLKKRSPDTFQVHNVVTCVRQKVIKDEMLRKRQNPLVSAKRCFRRADLFWQSSRSNF